ncbi:MAG: FG-GAP-like repeat-containing protein [bacterium]|nr:FG-GAP-like repeat-containing protein [bacterium]
MKYLRTIISQFTVLFFALAFLILPSVSFANTSNFTKQISYQAKLTDSAGVTVADGSYNMRFKLYNSLTGGSVIYTSTLIQDDRVSVASGLFSVMLGATSTSLSGVDFNQPLFMSIDIGGTANSASPTFDGEMTPRKTVGTVPHAFNTDTLDGLDSLAFVRTNATSSVATSSSQTLLTLNQLGSGDILSLQSSNTTLLTVTTAGKTGIGTTTPAKTLSVQGDALFAGSLTLSNLTATGTITIAGASTLSSTLSVLGLASFNGNASTSQFTATSSAYFATTGGLVGIGTTTPWGLLSVNPSALGSGIPEFVIGSTTATRFLIAGNGNVGIGTTSPGTLFSINGVANFTTGTTTFVGSGGINLLTNGCFSINNTCVGGSGSGSGTVNSGTAGQLPFYDSAGTTLTATSSIFLATNSNIGIGTTSPVYSLDVATTTRTSNFIAQNITLSQSFGSIMTAVVGSSTGYTNFTGGIGTGGADSINNAFNNALRITNTGNLVNIGSVQGGETLLTSAGTFATKVDYTAGTGLLGVALADFNGDGKTDMVTANNSANTMSIFINLGNNLFAAKVDYTTAANPQFAATGDFNGDGKVDIVVTSSTATLLSVFLNNGNGTFAAKVEYTAGTTPEGVAVGDLNGDGKADIVVANNGSNNVSVLMNLGNGTFAGKVNYTTGTAPLGVALADFNGDGRADMVSANLSSDSVSVFINLGNGTFAAKADATTNTAPFLVATGDLNGDGIADIATANRDSTSVSVLINNGNGTFATKVDLTTATSPKGIAIGDLNGDGRADLVAANSGSASASVFINQGGGIFAAKVDYTTGAGSVQVAIGDLNGDGKLDIATANTSDATVSVLLNQPKALLYANVSSGNVAIGTSTPTTTPQSLFAKLTVWASTSPNGYAMNVVDSASTTLFTITNAGNVGIGTTSPGFKFSVVGEGSFDNYVRASYFTATNTLATSTFAGLVGIGTTSPVYSLDVATTTRTSNFISDNITLSRSFGSIMSAVVGSSTGYTNFSGGIGTGGSDSTNNAFNNALRITNTGNLVNIGSVQGGETLLTKGGTFATRVTYGVGTTPHGVSVGDIDGDGKNDIVAANNGGTTISVLRNLGSGTFATKVDYTVGTNPAYVAITDLNGDGKADLAVTNFGSASVSILINNGNGTFASKVDYTASTNAFGIAAGDLNGDGKNDLAVVNFGDTKMSVFINNGNGTFAPRVDYAEDTGAYQVALGDINGDGRADIVVANNTVDSVSVFINNGNGVFAAKVEVTAGDAPSDVTLGDINGDNIIDIAVTNYNAGTLSILINKGDGTFATKVDYTTGVNPYEMILHDINGDDDPDIVVVNQTGDTASVFINLGGGTFSAQVTYPIGADTRGVAGGDLNGDGKVDIVSGSFGSSNVSVLMNQSSAMLYANVSSGNVAIGTSTPTTTPQALFAKLTVWGANTSANGYAFNVIDSASTTLFTITNAGSVGIGTTSPGYALHVKASTSTTDVAKFEGSTGNTACTLSATTGIISCTSDQRLKHDINPFTQGGGLEKIIALSPSTFVWNESPELGVQYGFIAQEMEVVLPHLVKTDKETGYKSISQIGLMPFVVKAIQDLASTTDTINTRLFDLGLLASSTNQQNSSTGLSIQSVIDYLASIGARIEQGMAYFKELFAEKITTNKLCIEDVCVTREEFKALLEKNSIGSAVSGPATTEVSESTPQVPQLDTEPPVIELIGNATSSIDLNASYIDPGATVTDNVDHNLGVVTTGSVDTTTAGDYVFTYNAEDSAGNKATELTRTITVVDPYAVVQQ